MHKTARIDTTDKPGTYGELAASLESLLNGERDRVACSANMASLIFWSLPDLNWAGFYFVESPGGDLVVGPFQGKPACVRIPLGHGVCGTAAASRKTLIVKNVHEFPGHIACDAASNSEIVVPIVVNGKLIGVLDLDSPRVARFDDADAAGLERLVEIFVAAIRAD